MRALIKRCWFWLLDRDAKASIVSFATGDAARVRAMVEEMRRLAPDRPHWLVGFPGTPAVEGVGRIELSPGSSGELWLQLTRALTRRRAALAPVLFDGSAEFAALRRAACWWAPRRILAYNRALERHHLQLSRGLASLLFLCGLPLDRIWLRPRWWPLPRRERSRRAEAWQRYDGRPARAGAPRVAVIAPYLPWPLSHGGAVRMYHLLKEAAPEYDLWFFGFEDGQKREDLNPVLEFCSRVYVADKPRYREPRWSSWRPPEVEEFFSPPLRRELEAALAAGGVRLLQTEYTQMASYGGDVLVEHDVTFDLFRQVEAQNPAPAARWNRWRWERFERRAWPRFRRVVVMSQQDRELTGLPSAAVIPNGVDLARFTPREEQPGRRLLFIGSFRHFPNVLAYRFLVDEVWPLLSREFPDLELTVVAGPEPDLFCAEPPPDPRIRRLAFVADVKPLYDEANLVLIPTLVSAGTNLKALEAMAARRAIVATASGVAGLGLEHGRSVWLGASAAELAAGVRTLWAQPGLRRAIAGEARRVAETKFDWGALGEAQKKLWRELLV